MGQLDSGGKATQYRLCNSIFLHLLVGYAQHGMANVMLQDLLCSLHCEYRFYTSKSVMFFFSQVLCTIPGVVSNTSNCICVNHMETARQIQTLEGNI